MVRDKSGFPLVTFLDSNIVVSPMYVKFREYLCILDLVYEFGDQKKGISVLYS